MSERKYDIEAPLRRLYEASQNKISKLSAQKIHAGFMNNGVELKPDGLRVM